MGFKKIGQAAVESGLLWVGDPCYVLNRAPERMFKAVGQDWAGFLQIIEEGEIDKKRFVQFGFDQGFDGLGVCLRPRLADGMYPVFGKISSNRRVRSISIRFAEDQAKEWEPTDNDQIGTVAVDAGMIIVSDPCFWLHQAPETRQFQAFGDTWPEFCEKLDEGGFDLKRYQNFNFFPAQIEDGGLGVAVSSGYGDGTYPVYARFAADGSMAEVQILFF